MCKLEHHSFLQRLAQFHQQDALLPVAKAIFPTMTAGVSPYQPFHHQASPLRLRQKLATTFSHNMHLTLAVIAAPLTEAPRRLKIDDFLMFLRIKWFLLFFDKKGRGNGFWFSTMQSWLTHSPGRQIYRSRNWRGSQAIPLYTPHHSEGHDLFTSTRGECPRLARSGRDKGYLIVFDYYYQAIYFERTSPGGWVIWQA